MGWLGFGSLNTYQNLSHSYLQKILCFHFHMVLSDFIWSKIELWLTPQKCKLLRTMWVSLVGTLLVILSPSFKKTNCGPLHTIKPQTFSICTVLDGILAWVPLTLMKLVKPHLSPKGRLKWQFLDSFTLLWLKLAKLLLLHT